MISRLLSSLFQPAPSAAPAIPEGQRVYAVGDIHGRLDLLERLLTRIDEDDIARPDAETRIIFLGDLIDRGPESAQVVERLRTLAAERSGVHILMGNHEEVFLQALSGDRDALAFFSRFGGRETLLSYGVDDATYRAADYDELLEIAQKVVPAAHRTFIKTFEDMIVVGDYAYVHAGIRPSTALTEQRQKDLRWIRKDFLNHHSPFEKVIVHGHTIAEDVENLANRIGLDTGAYASGCLSAMGFERSERWILQARDDG